MVARLFALKLFCAILLTATSLRGDPFDLPNDCGIIAAEAHARLQASCEWTRVISMHGTRGPKPVHHIVTAYQYDSKSNILLFDRGGTCEIPTKSHQINDIIRALETFIDGLCIKEAHFISSEP